MKQNKLKTDINSLTLYNPHIIAASPSFTSRFLFYYIFLLLGVSGAYGCFYTAFPVRISLPVLILCILLFCAVSVLWCLTEKLFIPLLLLAFILWLGGFCLLKDSFILGSIRTVNYILETYTINSNFSFITIPVPLADKDSIFFFCTVFSVLVLFPFAMLMAWLLIRRKRPFLCFLLTVPFPAASLVFTFTPHYAAAAILLLFWTFLLFSASSLGSRKEFVHKKNSLRFSGNTAARPASLFLLFLPFILLAATGFLFPEGNYERSDSINHLRRYLMNQPKTISSSKEKNSSQKGDYIDLKSVGNLQFTGKTVLRVKSSNPDIDYLKGFVGSVYTGHSWESLNSEDYEELNRILNDHKVQNFPYQFTTFFSCNFDSYSQEYYLTIENVNAVSQNIYSPYGLISAPSGIDFIHDGFLRANRTPSGRREYTLKALNFKLNYPASTYFERVKEHFSAELWWFDNSLYSLYLDKSFKTDFDRDIRRMDEWTMPKQLTDALTPAQADFAQIVQEYTRFVYEHYTRLPEELEDKLQQYLAQYNLTTDYYPRPEALASAIISQVHSENNYTLSPGRTPEGYDFVEYFLFEHHQGYCMHFASATAVLLRAAGIPARYAGGYTVSPAAAVDSEGWIPIPDSRAHAWVEIYISGTGWIPIEATPALAGQTTAPESPSSPSLEETETAVPTPDETPASEESSAGSSELSSSDHSEDERTNTPASVIKTILTWLSFILAAGVLSAPLLFTNRRLHVLSRNRKFALTDHNKAALAVYDYILTLYRHTKFTPDFANGLPDELYSLVLKARFSQHMLTRQEVTLLKSYARRLEKQIQNNLTKSRRFICKYIYGLM